MLSFYPHTVHTEFADDPSTWRACAAFSPSIHVSESTLRWVVLSTTAQQYCTQCCSQCCSLAARYCTQLLDPATGTYVLKKAGVVDSGAMGFAELVRGMELACTGEIDSMPDPTNEFEMVGRLA